MADDCKFDIVLIRELAMTNLKTIVLPAKGVRVPLPQILEICEQLGLDDLKQRIERDPPPKPFKSDGCSWFPDRLANVNLYPACWKHDLWYYSGYESVSLDIGRREAGFRLIADATLMIDAVELGLMASIAELMFNGVRAGGTSRWRLPFSWGYGR